MILSTNFHVYPGYIKILVSISPCQSCELSSQKLSRVRTEVVPTAIIRFHSFLYELSLSAVSGDINIFSLCMECSRIFSVSTFKNVPSQTCRQIFSILTHFSCSFSKSSGVKWSPAVGAATLHDFSQSL